MRTAGDDHLLRESLRAEFRKALKESGTTYAEFRERTGLDADYLARPQASIERLMRGLEGLGRVVEFRVFDPNEPVRPAWQPTDTSGWKL